jgi:hypothetical protein
VTLPATHAPPTVARRWADRQAETSVIVLYPERAHRVIAGRPTVSAPPESRPLVVDGYVRSTGQRCRFASRSELDRARIASWATARGWRIRGVFEESRSARLADDGSLLRKALERVESRESDGLVVARVTHLGASLSDAIAALERLSAAGGRFVSVCDEIDLGTPTGRLILRLLFSVLNW